MKALRKKRDLKDSEKEALLTKLSQLFAIYTVIYPKRVI